MEGSSRTRGSDELEELSDEAEAESEEISSRSEFSAASSFLWRAASSAATRSAMWSSRVLAREESVCWRWLESFTPGYFEWCCVVVRSLRGKRVVHTSEEACNESTSSCENCTGVLLMDVLSACLM